MSNFSSWVLSWGKSRALPSRSHSHPGHLGAGGARLSSGQPGLWGECGFSRTHEGHVGSGQGQPWPLDVLSSALGGCLVGHWTPARYLWTGTTCLGRLSAGWDSRAPSPGLLGKVTQCSTLRTASVWGGGRNPQASGKEKLAAGIENRVSVWGWCSLGRAPSR